MESIHTVTLPDIGEGVVEGEVVKWLKQKGDALKQDEPVVVVMTDKATVELPSPVPGTLETLFYQEGDIASVGKPLYAVRTASAEESKPMTAPKAPSQSKAPAEKKTESPTTVKAIPMVRKRARELNIDLETVQGTGKDGRITLEDLKGTFHPKEETLPHLEDDLEEKVVGIPRLMAERMSLSKKAAAHFSYFEELDATRLVQLKENFKKAALKEDIRITYMPFIIKAVSMTLKEFPRVNSTYAMDKGILYIHKHHNIGIAINTPLGLIVPVLWDVQEMPLEKIVRSYDSLIKRAKENALDPKEMKGSTITVSNFGGLEGSGRWATPVINYPEVAILALSRIQKSPMVKGEEVVVRDTLNLSWSFDHRVVDGNTAAAFSHHFASLIQNPAQLLQ